MKLAESFHVGADLSVDGMLYWHGIVVAGMYVIQIVFSDREHILEEKCGFPTVKLTEDNGEAPAVFLHLFIMDRPEFFVTVQPCRNIWQNTAWELVH